jgi:hypothetical protein
MASTATSFEEEEGDRSPPGKVVKEIDLEGLGGILEELTPKSNVTTTPNGTSRSSHSPRMKSMKSYDAATGAFSPSRTSTGEIADVMVFQSTAAAEDAEYEEEQRNMKKCFGLLHPSTKVRHAAFLVPLCTLQHFDRLRWSRRRIRRALVQYSTISRCMYSSAGLKQR